MKLQYQDFLSIEIITEESLMHISWLRSLSSAEYRAGLNHMQTLLPVHSIKWVLSDSQKLNNVTIEDQQWLKNEIFPKMIEDGITKVARVVKEDIFTYISFENLVETAYNENAFEVKIAQFSSVSSALAWLRLPE
ncbi:hypothetical protein D1627_00730 [Pontibacter oryzae]|uniref:STAS/SEC14 domain-containing protein n=2 Tax=Pontibacter oryzae TaxID=2304593 RepID=A0A399SHU3_9BACT|nr:hypothetical protein D1627_00730 [Pontibacter oryzae]